MGVPMAAAITSCPLWAARVVSNRSQRLSGNAVGMTTGAWFPRRWYWPMPSAGSGWPGCPLQESGRILPDGFFGLSEGIAEPVVAVSV
jgi:hypothetical protein